MNMKSHFGLRSHEQFSKMMPHGCIISCLLFNNFLTVKGQEIIFTRSLFNEQVDLSIQSIQRGISCNTCRLVGQHHQRSENIRHQIWRNTKVFLSQMQNGLCSLQIHTVQVLGSVAFERPWVELGLLACRMFGGSSVFSCLVIFYQTAQIKDINGKFRLHSHQVKPYMYMFLPCCK